MRKLLHSRLVAWFFFFFWLGLIFYLSSRPAFVVSSQEEIDNLAHIVAHGAEYGILALLTFHLFSFYLPLERLFPSTFVFSFLYSCSDEWHQHFVPTRQSSLGDILADVGGVIIVLMLLKLVSKEEK